MKKITNEKRYLPKKVKELLDTLTYERKDDLYCIIDNIYRIQSRFKSKLQAQYGYVDIPRSSFQKSISNYKYIDNAIGFLITNNVIKRNEFYNYLDGIPKGYKILSELLGTSVQVEITDKSINKRIKKKKMDMRKWNPKKLSFAKTKYFKTFKIDHKEALKAIEEDAMMKLNSLMVEIGLNFNEKDLFELIHCNGNFIRTKRIILEKDYGYKIHTILNNLIKQQLSVNAINDGFLYFKRNSTNGRLDTNLTSLPTYLRKFIRSNEKLINVDIKNSQPYFLFAELQIQPSIDKYELQKYSDLVCNGGFYEYLVGKFKWENKFLTFEEKRAKMKSKVFKVFFSHNNSYKGLKDFLGKEFPTIMDFINETNKESNANLANMMSKKESYTVLDVIMPQLNDLGIKPFTIHDSFVVTESESQKVVEVINNTCMKFYGKKPSLHTDELIKEVIEDDEEIGFPIHEDFSEGY